MIELMPTEGTTMNPSCHPAAGARRTEVAATFGIGCAVAGAAAGAASPAAAGASPAPVSAADALDTIAVASTAVRIVHSRLERIGWSSPERGQATTTAMLG